MSGAASLVLASASPRRRRLIGWLGVRAACVAADIPENVSVPLAPDVLAMSLAAEKARVAAAALPGVGGKAAPRARGCGLSHGAGNLIVLGFDTIVVHAGRVLGKPADETEAWEMIDALSGGVHEVVTGVAVLGAGAVPGTTLGGASGDTPGAGEPVTFAVTTPVLMRELDRPAVLAWIARGEYLGCAGAYNIEHHLASVADDECFQNVAGLPLCHVYRALASGAGGAIPAGLTSPVAQCDAALGRKCALGPKVCG